MGYRHKHFATAFRMNSASFSTTLVLFDSKTNQTILACEICSVICLPKSLFNWNVHLSRKKHTDNQLDKVNHIYAKLVRVENKCFEKDLFFYLIHLIEVPMESM